MGGSSKKTTQTYTPPSWVEDASRQAIDIGRRIGSREWAPYTGERIAQLSDNERRGVALAASSAGGWQPYIDSANAALKSAGQKFTDADIQAYMNPYIKGALDPAAREMREQGALRLSDLKANQSQRNAFGGARGALLESQAQTDIDQGISDLYGRGYAQAFESGSDRWAQDREADFRSAAGYGALGQMWQNANSADIDALMKTGATDRMIQQAMKDFDYQQFIEERNWDVQNLSGLLAAIQGTQGSYGTTQTTKEEESGNAFSQVMGLVSMAAGFMTGNPGAVAGGASMAGGGALTGAPSSPYISGGHPGDWMPQAPQVTAWGAG